MFLVIGTQVLGIANIAGPRILGTGCLRAYFDRSIDSSSVMVEVPLAFSCVGFLDVPLYCYYVCFWILYRRKDLVYTCW